MHLVKWWSEFVALFRLPSRLHNVARSSADDGDYAGASRTTVRCIGGADVEPDAGETVAAAAADSADEIGDDGRRVGRQH